MGTIKHLFQGLIMTALIGGVMFSFVLGIKLSYDEFEAFRSMIEAIGSVLLSHPFS